MIRYKIDIIEELAKHGYTTTRLRKEKLLSESTLQRIRNGENLKLSTINDVCLMLRCQPNDIIEIKPSDDEKIRFF